MKLHGSAALTPNGRLRLAGRVVDEGWSLAEAGEASEVGKRTARRWVRRYRAEGEPGLAGRCSAPNGRPGATPEQRIEAIAALRRVRLTGAETYRSKLHAIAPAARSSSSTCAPAPTAPAATARPERFVRTLLGGWAYGAIYGSSAERAAARSGWLDFCNSRRPHGSLGHKAPLERLMALQQANNLVGSYS